MVVAVVVVVELTGLMLVLRYELQYDEDSAVRVLGLVARKARRQLSALQIAVAGAAEGNAAGPAGIGRTRNRPIKAIVLRNENIMEVGTLV